MISKRRALADLGSLAHVAQVVQIAALGAALFLVPLAACGSGDDPAPEPEASEAGDPEASHPSLEGGAEHAVGPAVECAIGAAIEQEPNNTPATANAFTELGFCGVLESGTDVDYFTFTTPSGTKLGVFQAVVDGAVELALTLNGATFGPAETTKFGAGTYVVKAFTAAGKPASYRIRVQFDPL